MTRQILNMFVCVIILRQALNRSSNFVTLSIWQILNFVEEINLNFVNVILFMQLRVS